MIRDCLNPLWASQFVECGFLHVKAFHCFHGCYLVRLPQVNDFGIIVGERSFRSAEFYTFVERESDSLGLANANFAALLFGGVGEQLKDNVANQVLFKVGFLFRVQYRRVDYHDIHAHALNVEPLVLDRTVIPAEPVHLLDDERIAGSKHLVFQGEVALALKILAGLLVRNDVTLLNAVSEKRLNLTVEILLRAGNPGVTVCPSLDSSVR